MRSAFAVLVLLALVGAPVAAKHSPCPPQDCVPVVPIPDVPYVTGAVQLDLVEADVRIVDDLAATSLRLVLRNAGASAAQAEVTFPYPAGATVAGFNLTVDGTVLEGRVEERSQAQRSYDDAVAEGGSAALLRVADGRRVVLSVHVPAGATREVATTYREWVELAGAQRIYRLPLSQLPSTVGRVDVSVRMEGTVLEVQAPSLALQLEGAAAALAGSTSVAGRPQDLLLTWEAPRQWLARLFATAQEGPGFGALEVCMDTPDVLARDVVFVVDRSGSMAGEKITAARDALRAMLPSISPQDRYDIVAFDDHADAYHGALVAPAGNLGADDARLARLTIGGGTDIDAGLQEALRILGAAPSERLPMLVLLTDGLPSAGVTDHDLIIDRFVAHNDRKATVHVVPIGLDADHTFLADLALRSGGVFAPVDPDDGALDLRLERLFDTIGRPTVGEVRVTIDGVQATEALPATLPAVYEDQCLHVAFVAQFGAPVEVKVEGVTPSGPVAQTFRFEPADMRIDEGVAALWGRERVAELLSRERAGADVRAQIVDAGRAFNQLTPYTSWVVTEDAPAVRAEPQDLAFRASRGGALSTHTGAATSTLGVAADQEAVGGGLGKGGAQAPAAGVWLGLMVLLAAAGRRRR